MKHRSIIVTGAAEGIGQATALRFAASGDHLVLVDQQEEKCRSVVDSIKDNGGTAIYLHADVSRKLDVHNVIAEALDTYGRIDVLAHCDGQFFSAPLLETTEENFEQIINANLRSAFLMNQAVARQIIKQSEATDDGGVDQAQSGAIVNVTTTESVTADANHAIFAAAQGGLTQLTKAVAMTLSPFGARANTVGIAAIRKELDDSEAPAISGEELAAVTPLARKGKPEEAANAIHFLASPDASFITGQTLFVDGGGLAQYDYGRSKK
jgi:NAD(P)-dependent dehydrogenase (short-subunit alcohol dehydrogenase family)